MRPHFGGEVAPAKKKGDHESGHCRLHGGHPARPEDALAYFNRGRAYGKKGDLEKAIADYDDTIRLDGQFAESALQSGHSLRGPGPP